MKRNTPSRSKEYRRAYRQAHAEEIRIYLHNYKQIHHAKIVEQKMASRRRRPESTRQYRARPEKRLEYKRTRRALKKASGGRITAAEWKWLKNYYGNRCLCCGRKEPDVEITLDHVVPLIKGGKNIISNAQPLCRECNARKQARIIDYRTSRALFYEQLYLLPVENL